MLKNSKYIIQALSYFKHYRAKLVFILIMSIASITLGLIPVEIFRRIIDVAIPAKDLGLVLTMILIVFGTHLVLLFTGYIQDLLITKLSLDITRKMQGDLFTKLTKLSTSSYNQFSKGQLVERVMDDTGEITDSLFDLIISPLLNVVGIVITVIYMFTISPRLTIVVLVFVPVFFLLIIPVNKIIRKKYSRIKNAYSAVYNIIQQELINMQRIIKQKKEKQATKKLVNKIKSCNDLEYDYEKFSQKLQSIIAIVSDIAPYTILLYATYLIIQGTFEIGTLVAFTILMPRLFGPVRELAGKELEFQTLGVSAKRVFSIFSQRDGIIKK